MLTAGHIEIFIWHAEAFPLLTVTEMIDEKKGPKAFLWYLQKIRLACGDAGRQDPVGQGQAKLPL